MAFRLTPVSMGLPSFVDSLRCTDVEDLQADIAVIGVPYGVPYDMEGSRSPSSIAPQIIREQSVRYAPFLGHYDYDFGGELFGGREVRIVDCGDVAMSPGRYEDNQRATTEAVASILSRGVVPIIMGGDHSIPIPVLRAYKEYGPIYLIQFDAHLDFRDEYKGVREGLSSPMRRASEMEWVSGIAQIGLRGVGSARRVEYEAAKAYGSTIVGAMEVHELGVAEVLNRIPSADRYYITFDADALDPSIAPGVGAPAPGGLTYYQCTNLLKGLAARGRIVGFDFVEVQPEADFRNLTSMIAARLVLNLVGAMAHGGQIGRGGEPCS